MRASAPALIPAGNPGALTGAGNNTWLIDGVQPTLIDAGVGSPNHLAAVARALSGRSLVRVLVTHHHPDHASGVPALRETWPTVEVCKFPQHGETGWRAITDGESIPAGDTTLTVIHTPGHAADHVCFWDENRGDLYTGDMVLAETTVMIPAGRGGNLRHYLGSLERLAALRPARIYPGHGKVVDNPLEVIEFYLKHRHQREQEVRACLGAGVTDVEAIVERMYPDVPETLRRAARMTVEAHLEKLREDGQRA